MNWLDHAIEFDMYLGSTAPVVNKVTENQNLYAQNIETHIGAIKKLGQSVKELTKQVKRIQDNR